MCKIEILEKFLVNPNPTASGAKAADKRLSDWLGLNLSKLDDEINNLEHSYPFVMQPDP